MLPLAGSWTLDSFSRHLDGLDLFEAPSPACPRSATTARWAFESAAARPRAAPGRPLARRRARARAAADHLRRLAAARRAAERRARSRAGSPPTPGCTSSSTTRPSWDEELLGDAGRHRRRRVDRLQGRLQGHAGRRRDRARSSTARCAEAFPDAWLEDPDLTDAGADEALRPHRDRITWDAPIHGVADIEALPFLPRTINVKPSRIGTWRKLLHTYEWCAERGITNYGGGQSELGVGRGQIQYLASLFHGGEANDIAPSGYDWAEFPENGLPPNPLPPDIEPTGFRRRS